MAAHQMDVAGLCVCFARRSWHAYCERACATHTHTARRAFNVVYVTAHVLAGKWIGADKD
jgi:hypothetical protein